MKKIRCFICGKVLDDDDIYGTDEFPECREHHGAVEVLTGWLIQGGTKELLDQAAGDGADVCRNLR